MSEQEASEEAQEPVSGHPETSVKFTDPDSPFAKGFAAAYDESLAEIRNPKDSARTNPEDKPGPTENEISRTNLSLDGLNPDFHLKKASELTEAARERLAAIPDSDRIKTAEELVPTPQQAEELSHPETLVVPKTGQEITALKVNWPERHDGQPISKVVTVVLPAYLADPADGPAHETIGQFAMQMPDRPVFAISQPKLTRDQRRALDKQGDLGPTAGAMLEVMQAEGITDINIYDRSMGAWTGSTMAAMAHDYGITVHEAIFAEAANAGVSGKKIAKGFIRELANKFPDLYHARDPEMAKAARMDQSPIRKAAWEAAQFIKPLFTGRARDTLIRYPKGMAKGSLEGELDVAVARQPKMRVTLINGGTDPISTNEANDRVANNINSTHNPGGNKDNNPVSRIIHPGAPHSNLEDAKDTATIVRQRLELGSSRQ